MKVDFCVIGGGIAGVSIAAELSRHAKVIVLEREPDLAYHTSGRSAALYSELTAESTALALSKLSRDALINPPAGFSDYPLHKKTGCIFTATDAQVQFIEKEAAKLDDPKILDAKEMLDLVPILKTGSQGVSTGLLEEHSFRIDVAGLIQAYRKQFKREGGEVLCNAEVTALERRKNGWNIQLASETTITADRIVNAAGAWGDVVASLANVKPLGLSPLRRNIIVFDGPPGMDVSNWPAVAGIAMAYYFLPESGKLLGSAADEVPSAPCDAQPEEYDIALAADRIEAATTLEIRNIAHKWGGLRTFSADRQLVAGYDTENAGFFWFVGQGGFGMQTAPAASRAAARLALEKSLEDEFIAAGVTAEILSPERFTPA